jgi:ribosomal protein L18E
MRTIQCKKNDNACIVTDQYGNEYFRQGNHVAVAPGRVYPSQNVPQSLVIEAVEFTADEDVKVDESVYLQDTNNIIFDMIVGPRPKNIKKRK